MLDLHELKSAFGEEIRLIRHLATKLDPAKSDWRPSPGQRSTIELLRYLAICGIGPLGALVTGDWSSIAPLRAAKESLQLDGFDAAMAQQERELNAALDELGDAALAEREGTLPWGQKQPLATAIYNSCLRFLTAYRMQLFLYAKQSGATELSTHNAWMGIDKPQPSTV